MIFLSALILGIITGMRSMLGLAFVSWAVWHGYVDVRHSPFAFMGFHYTHIVFTILAIGELIGDKLPTAPSRKAPLPFVGRVLCGALCGATLGTGGQSLAFLLLLGVMGAIVGTMFGYTARLRLAIMQRDLTAALMEDAVAIALGCLCLAALRQVA